MTSVKVSKVALVKTLDDNRTKHIAEYEEAIAGWRVDYVEWLREALEQAMQADAANAACHAAFTKQRPTSHETEYDTALKMLEMSLDASIEMQEHEFRELVMDQWQWKNQFTAVNSAYLGKKA